VHPKVIGLSIGFSFQPIVIFTPANRQTRGLSQRNTWNFLENRRPENLLPTSTVDPRAKPKPTFPRKVGKKKNKTRMEQILVPKEDSQDKNTTKIFPSGPMQARMVQVEISFRL